MTYSLRVAPRAWKELEAAVAWYEEQRLGLGQEFAAAIDDALSDVMAAPTAGHGGSPTLPIDAGSSIDFHTSCSMRWRAMS